MKIFEIIIKISKKNLNIKKKEEEEEEIRYI